MIRQLQPWHANITKRQVKSPKLYVRDTGLLHHLLGIPSEKGLLSHHKLGASWEGYVVEEVIRSVAPDEAYFWATHNGAEIDLIVRKDGKLFGVECKRSDAPKLTPSMRRLLRDVVDDTGPAADATIEPAASAVPTPSTAPIASIEPTASVPPAATR